MYTAGSARNQREDAARRDCETIETSVIASSQSTSISHSSRQSTSALPSSSEKVDVTGGRKSAASSSSVTGSTLSPSLPTSASLSYYYYSPEVVGKSTNSTSGTRVDGFRRSLTESATPCVAEAANSPKAAPRHSTAATTVTTTTNSGLDLAWSSTTHGSGRISPKISGSGLVELTNDQRSGLTSGNDVGAVKAEAEVNNAALSTDVCLQEHLVASTCPDSSRLTDGRPLLAPSGEFVHDIGRFIPTRQVATPDLRVPSGFDINERIEPALLLSGQSRIGEVSESTPVNDTAHLHYSASQRCNEISLATAPEIRDITAFESMDVLPDDVFLPEVIKKSNNDVACVKPEMADGGADATAELAVGECAIPEVATDREERPSQLSRRDSFNRPDSPMFHQLMDLPRDSVILRNRRRRRRYSSSSSSSSSSSFLSNSRRAFASGTVGLQQYNYKFH